MRWSHSLLRVVRFTLLHDVEGGPAIDVRGALVLGEGHSGGGAAVDGVVAEGVVDVGQIVGADDGHGRVGGEGVDLGEGVPAFARDEESVGGFFR